MKGETKTYNASADAVGLVSTQRGGALAPRGGCDEGCCRREGGEEEG